MIFSVAVGTESAWSSPYEVFKAVSHESIVLYIKCNALITLQRTTAPLQPCIGHPRAMKICGNEPEHGYQRDEHNTQASKTARSIYVFAQWKHTLDVKVVLNPNTSWKLHADHWRVSPMPCDASSTNRQHAHDFFKRQDRDDIGKSRSR